MNGNISEDSIPIFYFTLNEVGVILSVNLPGAAYLGCSPQQNFVGQPSSEMFRVGEQERLQAALIECLRRPIEIVVGECSLVRKDGSEVRVEVTAQAMEGENLRLTILLVCVPVGDRQTEDFQRRDRFTRLFRDRRTYLPSVAALL